jgi:hypothetical protein
VQAQNDAMVSHDWAAVDWARDVWHSGWVGAIPDAGNLSPGAPAVPQGPPAWRSEGGQLSHGRVCH